MKNRFYSMLVLLTCMVMAMVALCAGTASAEEKNTEFLGKLFPDFTATDTEGNTFTLSEALKDHEAVLINIWATWCGPCQNEFPYLNEAYEKYHDRVAFIALSQEENDTIEKIAAYRQENGISFPMGRDEDEKLSDYINAPGIPDTVIVDRFGNAVYFHNGAFSSENAVERLLEAFVGDSYTETTVLDRIPEDTSTHAFPVSAARAISPDGGNYRKILLYSSLLPEPVSGYIIPEGSVRLRIDISPEDDAVNMIYVDGYQGKYVYLPDLLDPERGIYCYTQEVPEASDEQEYVMAGLFGDVGDDVDEKAINVVLFRNEEMIIQSMEEANALGAAEYRWEYADPDAADNTPQAYVLHVLDQDGNPVEGVSVNFCTDTACVPKESDEDGLITFNGAPDVYHVKIIDGPEGYSWDENYEMYTPREYGEWVLRVRKD